MLTLISSYSILAHVQRRLSNPIARLSFVDRGRFGREPPISSLDSAEPAAARNRSSSSSSASCTSSAAGDHDGAVFLGVRGRALPSSSDEDTPER